MSEIKHIKTLINNHAKRLRKLKEIKAQRGLSTPVELLTEIDDIENELRPLRIQLQALENTSPPPESETSNYQASIPLTITQRRRLEFDQRTLLDNLTVWEKRIKAIRDDISRTTDGERSVALEETLAEREAKREEILNQLEEIENKLGTA